MNRFTALLSILMLISTSLSAQIIWDKSRPISFEKDFHGSPHDSVSVAATYCGIDARVCKTNLFNGKVTITVEAIFDPVKSWYRPDKIHQLTLQHEQGHFDMAEWFARRLRKTIQEHVKTINDFRQIFQSLFDSNYHDYYLMQERYELETKFGTVAEAQEKWNATILENINQLEEFAYVACTKK